MQIILSSAIFYFLELSLEENKNGVAEIFTECGIVKYWVEMGSRKSDSTNLNLKERSNAISLLFDIWMHFPKEIEQKKECAEYVIKSLQRAIRDKSSSLQILALGILFKLLDQFAIEKNTYAAVIYKTVTFALVENILKSDLREFIEKNMACDFRNVPYSASRYACRALCETGN